MKHRKETLFAAVLVGLSMMVGLALTEGVLYALEPGQPYPKSPGANAVYTIRNHEFAHQVKTNSLNFRSEEFAPRSPEQIRIVTIGDSFTFGLGVEIEDAYPSIFEDNLKRAGIANAYILNVGGRPNFAGPAYRTLKQYHEVLDPDLVILQVYTGNDFYDGMSYSEQSHEIKRANQQRHLARTSLLHQVKHAVKSIRTFRLAFQGITAIPVIDRWLVKHGYRWDERHLLLKTYPDLESKLSEQVIYYIERIHTYLNSHDIDLIVLLVPFREQFIKRHRLIADLHDPEKPNRLLRERLTALGMQVVDLYQTYEKLTEDEIQKLYYRKDIHWTKAGNRHAADVLTDYMLRSNAIVKAPNG